MKLIEPHYYETFRCIAADCPAPCCSRWEVVLDPATAARYQALSPAHPLYTRLQEAVATGEDGPFFALDAKGNCPFFGQNGLCDIQSALGEDWLSETCQSYPRWKNDFGGTRERGLSLSCPAAANLILRSESLQRIEKEDPTLRPGLHDLDAERYFAVRTVREAMLRILQTYPIPIGERMALLLRLGKKAGKQLQKGRYDRIPDLVDRFGPHQMMRQLQSCWQKAAGVPSTSWGAFIEALEPLEVLSPDWHRMLQAFVCPERVRPLESRVEENLLGYFLWRYLLQAAWEDGDLFSLTRFSVASVLTIRLLLQGEAGSSRLWQFSREVEHDPENLERLRQRYDTDPAYRYKALLGRALGE